MRPTALRLIPAPEHPVQHPPAPPVCECAWCETGLSSYCIGPLTRERVARPVEPLAA